MSLLKRAGDLVYTFRFLTLLTTPFENTEAFKLGIIDADGKRLKDIKLDSDEQRSAYTPFHRLVFNVKRLMAKAPGGSSRVASYAAALYLIKEKLDLSDRSIEKIMEKAGIDPLDILNEDNKWFVLDDLQLSPGVYKVRESKLLNVSCADVVNKQDKVRVADDSYPVGNILGMDVYEATHIRTNQKVYVTIGELLR